MTGKLLVTGASGKLGDLAARGVETRTVDFDDASLAESFAGVDRVLIISTDALDAEGTRLRQQLAAVAAAKAAGVSHISYTSMPNPGDAKVIFAPDHKGTEDAIIASGLGYTIFRNSWYMENLMMTLPQALATGQWFTSAGAGKLAHISREDVARAIAANLAKGASEDAIYTLTGPVARTTDEIAALVSEVTDKPLAVVHVTDAQLAQGMEGAGVPAPLVPTFVSFDTNTREGKIDIVTDDATLLSGNELTSLKDFLDAIKPALLG